MLYPSKMKHMFMMTEEQKNKKQQRMLKTLLYQSLNYLDAHHEPQLPMTPDHVWSSLF